MTSSRKQEGNSQSGRKFLQIIRLIRELDLEYGKNACNPIIKRQKIKLKHGQRIWIDLSPKKINTWPVSTGKDAQHRQSAGKSKSKPQWDPASRALGWLDSQCQKTSAGRMCTSGVWSGAVPLENSRTVPPSVKHTVITWPEVPAQEKRRPMPTQKLVYEFLQWYCSQQ